MKGSLLNGFKVWIQDGRGLPLSAPYGRVKFYKANTSEPLEVYSTSSMDVPLGTVVYTDINGYLPDVWLRTDYLYDVVAERKIGEDPETWVKLFDVKDVGEIVVDKIESSIATATFVHNVAELRDVDYTKIGIVYVLGYNDAGDTGEPMVFKYESGNRKVEDGGSVIIPNDRLPTDDGRWVQIFNESIIDVRKFGALPGVGGDVSSQINKCIIYCLDSSKRDYPLTIGFLAPGKYNVMGDLNLDQYTYTKDGERAYAHFIINSGVVFYGVGPNTALVVGRNSDILSNEKIVGGEYKLSVPSQYKGAVNSKWYGTKPSTIDNAVVYGEDGMSLVSNDSIVIYRDMHKLDLWDVGLEKLEGSYKGMVVKLLGDEIIRFNNGQQNSFRFNGKMYTSGLESTSDVNVRNYEGDVYTSVGFASISLVGGDSSTRIDSNRVKTNVVEASTKVDSPYVRTDKFAYLNYVDITSLVEEDYVHRGCPVILEDYYDEPVGFRIVLHTRKKGGFSFYTISSEEPTKTGTIAVVLEKYCALEFVKVGNRPDIGSGAYHSTWIMLCNGTLNSNGYIIG